MKKKFKLFARLRRRPRALPVYEFVHSSAAEGSARRKGRCHGLWPWGFTFILISLVVGLSIVGSGLQRSPLKIDSLRIAASNTSPLKVLGSKISELKTAGEKINPLKRMDGEEFSDEEGEGFRLNEENTVSVTANERDQAGVVNASTYRGGEWTGDRKETYGTLIRFNFEEFREIEKGVLHLTIKEYGTSDRKCNFRKAFLLKKVTEEWDPQTIDYNRIEEILESEEVITSFGVNPGDTEISLEVPLKAVMDAHGIAIDQTEESYCLVSFYSHSAQNEKRQRPYIVVEGVSEE